MFQFGGTIYTFQKSTKIPLKLFLITSFIGAVSEVKVETATRFFPPYRLEKSSYSS